MRLLLVHLTRNVRITSSMRVTSHIQLSNMAKIEHEQAQDVWACGLVAMCILGENLDPLGLKQCSSLAEKELKKKDAMFTMAVWIEEHLRQAAENIENEVSGSASGKGKEKDDGTEEDHTIQERVSETIRPLRGKDRSYQIADTLGRNPTLRFYNGCLLLGRNGRLWRIEMAAK